MTPGELILELRRRKGLSQRRLARRAGTSQAAIGRVERGEEDVTWGRLRALLLAMGEEPVLASTARGARYDPDDLLHDRRRPAPERLESGFNQNLFATELAVAGRRERRRG